MKVIDKVYRGIIVKSNKKNKVKSIDDNIDMDIGANEGGDIDIDNK